MCDRYSLARTDRIDWRAFGVAAEPGIAPRWNIAPGAIVLAIREGRAGREAVSLRWGLVPALANDVAIGNRPAHGQAESAHEKPTFRSAFKSRRCLLPADGWYAWQVIKGDKKKQPWRVEAKDGGVVALGALWEAWTDPRGATLETCAILTVPANGTLEAIADRMPLVLDPAQFPTWLAKGTTVEEVRALCRPAPDSLLGAWRISLAINTPSHDGPSLAAPIA